MSTAAAMGCGKSTLARSRVRLRAGLLMLAAMACSLAAPAAASAANASLVTTWWTAVTGADYQYSTLNQVDHKVFVNTNQAGSFDLTVNISEGTEYAFPPSIGSGWTLVQQSGSAPGIVSGRYAWTAGADDPGTISILASGSGDPATVLVTIRRDITGPTLAFPLYYPDSTIASPASVSYNVTSDGSGAGLASGRLLQRMEGTYAAGACTDFPAFWTTIETDPANSGSASKADNTITTGHCYRYRYVVTDRVGNTSTFTKAGADLKFDSSLPVGNAITQIGNLNASGWTNDGSVTVSFTPGSDPESGLLGWRLERVTGSWNGTECIIAASASYEVVADASPSSPYTDSGLDSGSCYRYKVVSTNTLNRPAPSVAGSDLTAYVDTVQPADLSIDVPLSAWVSGSTASITHDEGSDPVSGIASWTIQRRIGTYDGSACTGLGSWSAVLAANPGSPWTTTGLVHGACYQFKLTSTDLAGNSATATSGTVNVDQNPPTGTMNAPAVISNTANLYGLMADDLSGIGSVSVAYSGDNGSGEACLSEFVDVTPTSWGCTWYAAAQGVLDGTYRLTLIITDVAGGATNTATRDITLDQQPPTGSIASITPGIGLSYQYVSGSQLWINPAYAGSVTVALTANDSGTGVDTVSFPDLDGPGEGTYTPGGATVSSAPWSQVYVWGSNNSVLPVGAVTATITDRVGRTRDVSFTVTADRDIPSAGTVSVTPTTPGNTGSATVTFTAGTDTGSGVKSVRLERTQSTYTYSNITGKGECGNTWSAPSSVYEAVIASPTPLSLTGLSAAKCHRFQVVTVDRVGNSSTALSSGTVKVDQVAPAATGTQVTGESTASTIYLSGSVVDASSGTNRVYVTYAGPAGASGQACAHQSPTGSTWQCQWNTSALADGTYTLTVKAIDAAGNDGNSGNGGAGSTVTHVVNLDDPVVALAGVESLDSPSTAWAAGGVIHYQPLTAGSLTISASATDPNGINRVTFPTLLGATGWSAGGNSTSPASPFTWTYSWSTPVTDPGTVTITAYDAAGNGGRSGSTSIELVPDTTAPTISLGAISTPFSLLAGIPLSWSTADADAGDPVTASVLLRAAPTGLPLPGTAQVVEGFTSLQGTSITYPGVPGMTYCFSMVAIDGAANEGARSVERCTAIPLTATALSAGGRWTTSTVSAAYGGSTRTAKALGASLAVSVSSIRHVSLIATTCSACGSVKVMLGTTRLASLSLSSPRLRRRRVLPVLATTSGRSGTLKVVVTSSSKPVIIEGLAVSHA